MGSLSATNDIISIPGLYIVGGDIVDTSSGANGPLITITTSNVVFDLAEHLIYQDPFPTTTTSAGILIEPGLNNITIQNGSIGAIGGAGIIVSEGCSNILIQNISVSECSAGGIVAKGTGGNPINGITILGSSLSSCTGTLNNRVAGIDASYTNAFLIQNSYFSHNTHQSGSAYGIYCNNSISGEVISCRCTGNTGLDSSAGTYLQTCTNIRVIDCSFTQNITSGNGAAYGIYIGDCTSIACENSLAGAELCFSGSAYGIYSTNSAGIGIKNSISAEHIGGYVASTISFVNGTQLILVDNTLEGCIALAGTAYGLEVRNSSLCSVRNNTILNNTGIGAFGAFDDGAPSTSVYLGNYAFNNGTNFSITYTGGVTLPILNGSLSGPPGLPTNTGGLLDNISITM